MVFVRSEGTEVAGEGTKWAAAAALVLGVAAVWWDRDGRGGRHGGRDHDHDHERHHDTRELAKSYAREAKLEAELFTERRIGHTDERLCKTNTVLACEIEARRKDEQFFREYREWDREMDDCRYMRGEKFLPSNHIVEKPRPRVVIERDDDCDCDHDRGRGRGHRRDDEDNGKGKKG